MNTQSLLAIACLILTTGASGGADSPGAQSPAQRRIERARLAIEAEPAKARAHNDLALGLARRARETADPEFYIEAQASIAESLRLSPGNLEARKIEVWTLLGQHEFALALVHAKELNRLVPDDLSIYGYLADAHIELGNMPEAEEAVQWMLNLRPGNVPGMTRAAYMRELFGDVEGALDLMLRAYHSIDPTELEDRAWTLTHAAHLELSRGSLRNAEVLLDEAQKLFPGYHYALAELAELRRAQGRFGDEVALLAERAEKAPHPENFGELAYALERNGQSKEAAERFSQFEDGAQAESASWDNANRELIARFVETGRADQALRLARMEMSRREDVRTLDAYAWALNANGDFEEARIQIERALAIGELDARMLYHAGVIAQGQGDLETARDYMVRSLGRNPHSAVAASAQSNLAEWQQTTE